MGENLGLQRDLGLEVSPAVSPTPEVIVFNAELSFLTLHVKPATVSWVFYRRAWQGQRSRRERARFLWCTRR